MYEMGEREEKQVQDEYIAGMEIGERDRLIEDTEEKIHDS